jgi:hypothetical protein
MTTSSGRPRLSRVFLDRDGHYVTAVGPVFVQVRAGPISVEVVREIGTHAHAFLAQHKGKVCALAVLEDTATMPDAATREAQQTSLVSLLDEERVLLAGVVMGQDTDALLRRAVARGLVSGNRRKRTFTGTLDAVQWLAKELAIDAGPVSDVLEHARRAARASRKP